MDPSFFSIILSSPKATQKAAFLLGSLLQEGDIIGLEGPLGVGKTHFVKGLAQGLQIPTDTPITSPSFAIIQEYQGRLPLFHADLYRIEHTEELVELGLWESEQPGIWVVEWLSRFPESIPQNILQITLSFQEKEKVRLLSATAFGDTLTKRLHHWQELLQQNPIFQNQKERNDEKECS